MTEPAPLEVAGFRVLDYLVRAFRVLGCHWKCLLDVASGHFAIWGNDGLYGPPAFAAIVAVLLAFRTDLTSAVRTCTIENLKLEVVEDWHRVQKGLAHLFTSLPRETDGPWEGFSGVTSMRLVLFEGASRWN